MVYSLHCLTMKKTTPMIPRYSWCDIIKLHLLLLFWCERPLVAEMTYSAFKFGSASDILPNLPKIGFYFQISYSHWQSYKCIIALHHIYFMRARCRSDWRTKVRFRWYWCRNLLLYLLWPVSLWGAVVCLCVCVYVFLASFTHLHN